MWTAILILFVVLPFANTIYLYNYYWRRNMVFRKISSQFNFQCEIPRYSFFQLINPKQCLMLRRAMGTLEGRTLEISDVIQSQMMLPVPWWYWTANPRAFASQYHRTILKIDHKLIDLEDKGSCLWYSGFARASDVTSTIHEHIAE